MLRRLAKDETGNIITVLGLSTLTLLGAVSAGLDYTRMTNTRTAISAAADAAALAAAQAAPEDAAALARQVFDANFRDLAPVTSFAAEPFAKGADKAYRVEATASVPMSLTRVIGAGSRPVRSVSEVLIGNDEDTQVALVLDVTGSMTGAKLESLKTSASSMVRTLHDKLTRANQLKIAVVPFAEYVNVGERNRYQPWLSVPSSTSTSQNVCWIAADVTSATNCRNELQSWDSCNDGVCVRESGYAQVCDYTYGPQYQVCSEQTNNSQWYGCVGSRDYPLNVRDENYAIKPVPGLLDVACPPALTPLSANRSVALSAIDGLSAFGETYIPSGLMWGWAVLTPRDPYNEPTDSTRKTRRHLVLMTDGENTKSPTYPYHYGSDPRTADTLTSELCTNIKAADIEVFTIAFDVTSTTIKALLRNCASSGEKYFDAADSTQLASAFDAIGQQMTQLRISR